jgi:hypothetical protein
MHAMNPLKEALCFSSGHAKCSCFEHVNRQAFAARKWKKENHSLESDADDSHFAAISLPFTSTSKAS